MGQVLTVQFICSVKQFSKLVSQHLKQAVGLGHIDLPPITLLCSVLLRSTMLIFFKINFFLKTFLVFIIFFSFVSLLDKHIIQIGERMSILKMCFFRFLRPRAFESPVILSTRLLKNFIFLFIMYPAFGDIGLICFHIARSCPFRSSKIFCKILVICFLELKYSN